MWTPQPFFAETLCSRFSQVSEGQEGDQKDNVFGDRVAQVRPRGGLHGRLLRVGLLHRGKFVACETSTLSVLYI